LVGGNLVLFALGTMAFGVPFVLTQYAQEVLHWSPVHFGLASVVMPVTAVAGTAGAEAIAVAVLGMAAAGLLLGRRREPQPVTAAAEAAATTA
jgi:hypothetical protein